jgi:hypothetical protein
VSNDETLLDMGDEPEPRPRPEVEKGGFTVLDEAEVPDEPESTATEEPAE